MSSMLSENGWDRIYAPRIFPVIGTSIQFVVVHKYHYSFSRTILSKGYVLVGTCGTIGDEQTRNLYIMGCFW